MSRLLVALTIALILGYLARGHAPRQPAAACKAMVRDDGYYADPVSRSCGLILIEASRHGPPQGFTTPCPDILLRPAFAEVRKCWTSSQ